MKRPIDIAAPWLLLGLLLAVWETACRLSHVPPYFLPPPSAVAAALVETAPVLAASAAVTFGMALQALVVAFIVGGGLALLVSLSRPVETAVRPLAVALQVTPVVAIAPLVLIWFGLDHADRAVVALAAAVAVFPLFSGVLTGLNSADPDLERLFDLYGASPLQRLRHLRLPTALPFVLEGLRVAVGLAVIGAVVAEFVSGSGATQGLAWRLLEAGNRLRTADLLAALTWLTVMGLVLNAAVAAVERAIARRSGRPLAGG
ncbi:MAG: ABC transporter permease [Caulobacterales bacterium]|nr:ABC transporter permease [Caulobacterales bacterium]